ALALQGGGLREHANGGLAGAVSAGPSRSLDAGYGRDVDNAAAGGMSPHGEDGVPGAEEDAVEVDGENAPPRVERHVGDGRGEGDAGRVDEDVEAAVCAQDVLHRRLPRWFGGDVEGTGRGCAACGSDGRGRVYGGEVQVGANDGGAFPGEEQGRGTA